MSVAVDPSDAITRLREVEASGGTHHIWECLAMGRAKRLAQQDALRKKNEPAVKSEWKELVERCIVISKDHAPQSQEPPLWSWTR